MKLLILTSFAVALVVSPTRAEPQPEMHFGRSDVRALLEPGSLKLSVHRDRMRRAASSGEYTLKNRTPARLTTQPLYTPAQFHRGRNTPNMMRKARYYLAIKALFDSLKGIRTPILNQSQLKPLSVRLAEK